MMRNVATASSIPAPTPARRRARPARPRSRALQLSSPRRPLPVVMASGGPSSGPISYSVSRSGPYEPPSPVISSLASRQRDLEREQVLPLASSWRAARRTHRRGAQGEEGVVLDLHVPELGAELAEGQLDVAGEVAGEVDEVAPLVEQLATARELALRPPLGLVAEATTVAVAGPDVQERPVPTARRPSSLARRNDGWKRWLNPTRTSDAVLGGDAWPGCSTPSSVRAPGFSTSTWRPASTPPATRAGRAPRGSWRRRPGRRRRRRSPPRRTRATSGRPPRRVGHACGGADRSTSWTAPTGTPHASSAAARRAPDQPASDDRSAGRPVMPVVLCRRAATGWRRGSRPSARPPRGCRTAAPSPWPRIFVVSR